MNHKHQSNIFNIMINVDLMVRKGIQIKNWIKICVSVSVKIQYVRMYKWICLEF